LTICQSRMCWRRRLWRIWRRGWRVLGRFIMFWN